MNKDTKNCLLYIVNGAICDIIERENKYPTIEQVRKYPSVAINCSDIEDNEISRIINDVRGIDEREFLNRHNWLSDNIPGYYGFKRFFEDENGRIVFRFISNDDLCRKLGNRILNS